MSEIIVPYAPPEYSQQPSSDDCGFYSIHALLSALGLAYKDKPEKYPKNLIEKALGATMPSSIPKLLAQVGINSEVRSAWDLDNQGRLEVIKREIDKGHPVILLVRSPGRYGESLYGKARRNWMGHWISIWGYDDEKKIFYVYDSAKQDSSGTLPIGNAQRTFEELSRDWRGPSLLVPRHREYSYIALTSLPKSANKTILAIRTSIAESMDLKPEQR